MPGFTWPLLPRAVNPFSSTKTQLAKTTTNNNSRGSRQFMPHTFDPFYCSALLQTPPAISELTPTSSLVYSTRIESTLRSPAVLWSSLDTSLYSSFIIKWKVAKLTELLQGRQGH